MVRMVHRLVRKQMTSRTNLIGFRLPDELLVLLDDECRRTKMSRGQLAKAMLISCLMRPSADEPLAGHDELLESLEQIRDSLGAVLKLSRQQAFLVLTRIAGVDAADAKRLLDQP